MGWVNPSQAPRLCGVFLDFKKAFDTENHNILLSKLEYCSIRGIPHELIKSYLTNRKHYTHINTVDSNTLTSNMVYQKVQFLGHSNSWHM